MELKSQPSLRLTTAPPCLNRTFMELNFVRRYVYKLTRLQFKSHLYGIEMVDIIVGKKVPHVFKSHLYGIEICSTVRL